MSRIPMMLGYLFALAISLVILGLMYLERLERDPCRPLETISNDPELNERLRSGLNDFINDEAIRHKLDGTPHGAFQMLNEFDFDKHFPWISVFDDYAALRKNTGLIPILKRQAELVLRVDGGAGRFVPPYRISEVGVYAGRSLIMYKNESETQYLGGAGTDRLSQKSYVKCKVDFEDGSPFE